MFYLVSICVFRSPDVCGAAHLPANFKLDWMVSRKASGPAQGIRQAEPLWIPQGLVKAECMGYKCDHSTHSLWSMMVLVTEISDFLA